MPYKFFDHTADVLFEATGKTLEELFESSALAVTNTMVETLRTVKPKIKKIIKIKGDDTENLLFNFLQEIIFLKDAEQLLLTKFNIKIIDNNLTAEAHGEKLNMKKHELIVDVKAVTMHEFYVKKEKNKWKARVILDI